MTVKHVYGLFRQMSDRQRGSFRGHTALTGLEMVLTGCTRKQGMRVKSVTEEGFSRQGRIVFQRQSCPGIQFSMPQQLEEMDKEDELNLEEKHGA